MTNTRTRALAQPRQSATAQAAWIAAFAALTAAGARIEIFHAPVPFTLQTFVVLLSGAVLGARNGALSQVAYLLAGIAGLPVFAATATPDTLIGFTRLMGPTGGYLLAFPVAAFIVGECAERFSHRAALLAGMSVAMLVIFFFGAMQLYLVWLHDWTAAFVQGFLIFSWWDVAKIALAFAAAEFILAKRKPT